MAPRYSASPSHWFAKGGDCGCAGSSHTWIQTGDWPWSEWKCGVGTRPRRRSADQAKHVCPTAAAEKSLTEPRANRPQPYIKKCGQMGTGKRPRPMMQTLRREVARYVHCMAGSDAARTNEMTPHGCRRQGPASRSVVYHWNYVHTLVVLRKRFSSKRRRPVRKDGPLPTTAQGMTSPCAWQLT